MTYGLRCFLTSNFASAGSELLTDWFPSSAAGSGGETNHPPPPSPLGFKLTVKLLNIEIATNRFFSLIHRNV